MCNVIQAGNLVIDHELKRKKPISFKSFFSRPNMIRKSWKNKETWSYCTAVRHTQHKVQYAERTHNMLSWHVIERKKSIATSFWRIYDLSIWFKMRNNKQSKKAVAAAAVCAETINVLHGDMWKEEKREGTLCRIGKNALNATALPQWSTRFDLNANFAAAFSASPFARICKRRENQQLTTVWLYK